MNAPVPVVSGRPYRILGLVPGELRTLGDFVGELGFDIDLDGAPYRVCGTGRAVAGAIRFYEKDSGGSGKDVRVWAVSCAAAADFVAEHVP